MKKFDNVWSYRFYVSAKFLEALGVLMLLYELVMLITPVAQLVESHKTCCFFIIILFSLCYALFRLVFPKKKITLEINKRTQLTIEKGDVMAADGARVIPVNEFFDTHLGDGIINVKSLHGQLLSLYQDRISELRHKIDEQLKGVDKLPSNRNRTMVDNLPQNRYPLGTCIRLNIDGQCYLLVATTRFNANEHVEVSAEEYPEVIRKMFNGIEQFHDGNPVYIPLVGSGLAGYDMTNMQMLNTMVQTANNTNRLSLSSGLYLYIYSDEQMKSINLNTIKYLFDRWITLK